MKVLVTGSDGLLGNNLIRELLNRNVEVSALILEGTQPKTLDELTIERIYGNILNPDDLLKSTRNVDCVVHCAASTAMFPARSETVNRINIDGTRNIIDACKKNGVKRLIYVGTATSFGSGNLDSLGDETNPYCGGKYGLDYLDSKFVGQREVLNASKSGDLETVVVNPTFMIGPFDSRPSSGEMILKVYKRQLPGYTLGGKNWVSVKDVAVAIANAIDKGKNGECYILGNANLTYKQAFEMIANVVGVEPPRMKLATAVVRTLGRFNSFIGNTFKFNPGLTKELATLGTEVHFYSSEKAVKDLNMPQTPIEFAVKECFMWFDENGYLTKK